LPRECARVREVLSNYEEVFRMPDGSGRGCAFAIAMIKQSLAAADRAMISGDVVEMLRCYNDLKETE
jgi:hypothetical protein